MDNTIYTDMDDTIGFYKDLARGYKEMISQAVSSEDYEEAKDLMEQLEEIKEYSEYDDLLILSMNNGMGFTCKPYQTKQTRGE